MAQAGSLLTLLAERESARSSELPAKRPDCGDDTRGARARRLEVGGPLRNATAHVQFLARDGVGSAPVLWFQIPRPKKWLAS